MARKPTDEEIIRTLMPKAKLRINAWLKQAGLNVGGILTDGLKRSTYHRITDLNQIPPELEKWLTSLAGVFERINAVTRASTGKTRSWEEVFGTGFPLPPVSPDPSISNYADLTRGEVRRLARPLVEFLKGEYHAADGLGNIWKSSQLLLRLCGLYEMSEDWSRAAEGFARLGRLNAKTGDFHYVADAALREGVARFYNNELPEAAACFEKGLAVIEAHKEKSIPRRTHLRLLNYSAMTLSGTGEHEAARRMLEGDCLPLAEKRASPAAVASVWNRLGIVCLRAGDIDAAFEYLVKALERRAALTMKSELAKTLRMIGRAHELRGEVLQAILLLQVSVMLQSELRDHEHIALTKFDLGRTYALLHRSEKKDRSPIVSVSLSEEDFRDARELAVLRSLCNSSTRKLALRRDRLVAHARDELETALIWATEVGKSELLGRVRDELSNL